MIDNKIKKGVLFKGLGTPEYLEYSHVGVFQVNMILRDITYYPHLNPNYASSKKCRVI